MKTNYTLENFISDVEFPIDWMFKRPGFYNGTGHADDISLSMFSNLNKGLNFVCFQFSDTLMSTILIAITPKKITGRGISAQPNRPHDLVDNFILDIKDYHSH